ncbi:MAG: DUF4932 domain-containing protein [Niabella sp.]|nr:DUF4932 domain-containing protein [Niabella sp.]
MKSTVIILFILISVKGFSQNKKLLDKPMIDKRVELLSIVFRLSGSNEYSSTLFKIYTDKIDAYYGAYKNHELIQYIKKIRQENGIGYDAVMKMAIYIDDRLNPLVPFTENIPEKRWGKERAYRFVKLLKKFYDDTNSKQFFKDNRRLYREVSKRFLPVYEHLDLSWYKSFYGKKPNEKFIIINGLGNGGGNYGVAFDKPDGARKVYAIMGTWQTDSLGMADFSIDSYFPTLLHEFNHSFVNYLLNKDPKPFKESCAIIYDKVKEKMNNAAYGSWETMFSEALVRATVIKYMKDHRFSKEEILNQINEELNNGFLWIEDLVAELERYDKQRNTYPTLESYFPQLALAYNVYAKNMNTYITKYIFEGAKFASITEFSNGDQNVDASLKQITINFDKPFSGAHFIRPGEKGKAFPSFTKLTYSGNKRSVILDCALERNKEYQFVLIGLSPQKSEEHANDDYEINFRTK